MVPLLTLSMVRFVSNELFFLPALSLTFLNSACVSDFSDIDTHPGNFFRREGRTGSRNCYFCVPEIVRFGE